MVQVPLGESVVRSFGLRGPYIHQLPKKGLLAIRPIKSNHTSSPMSLDDIGSWDSWELGLSYGFADAMHRWWKGVVIRQSRGLRGFETGLSDLLHSRQRRNLNILSHSASNLSILVHVSGHLTQVRSVLDPCLSCASTRRNAFEIIANRLAFTSLHLCPRPCQHPPNS